MFSALLVSFFFVPSDAPSLHNHLCYAVIYCSKKYFVVFISNLLLAFIWCFLNLLQCKTIYYSLSPCLVAVEVPVLVPCQQLLATVCFVLPHEEPTHHIMGVFIYSSLILLSSFGGDGQSCRKYSRALNKRFSSNPPWHCLMLQTNRRSLRQ